MNDCSQLDAYLQGDLSLDEETRFAEHLMVCADCERALAQQRWLDDLLREAAAAEPIPAELETVAVSQPTVSLPGWTWQVPAIAAALLLALFLWPKTELAQVAEPKPNFDEPSIDKPSINEPSIVKPSIDAAVASEPRATATRPPQQELDPPSNATASVRPKATFIAEDDVIVVPIESDSPEVSIIQVYPTAQARSRWRREALLETSFVSNTGG